MTSPPRPCRPRVVHCKRQPYDVYIGRPSPWGNPYRIGVHGTRAQCIEAYRDELLRDPKRLARVRAELRGKTLGCWCAPEPCHGDVLLEVANAAPDP